MSRTTQKQFDLVIVGGGIVGLSTGMTLGKQFPRLRLVIVEKEDRIAAHQTGHNSGVIHAGLYYRPGSLKAKACVQGAAAMVDFCREHDIAHEICGKLVIATQQDELLALDEIYRRGTANGVPNLSIVGQEQLREVEPHCSGIRGLKVPSTGIVDYVAVAKKYASIIGTSGGEIITGAKVTGVVRGANETVVQTTKGDIATRYMVNCAGLQSDLVAKLAGSEPGVMIVPFRGEYYDIIPERRHLVKGLIYPVPDPKFPFVGVHFTRRITGGFEAGPNAVLALRREGYHKTDVSLSEATEIFTYPGFWRMARKYWRDGFKEYYRSLSKKAFARALQRLVPEIQESDLHHGGSGVRAQAVDRQGKLLDDFQIVRSGGIVHVVNAPSPAATASLFIGRHISEMLAEEGELAAYQ